MNIDALKLSVDLVALAEKAGAQLHKHGNEWRGNCPLHAGNNPTGFVVYETERRWQCFSGDCGNGDALDFVMKWKGCTLQEAYRFLGGQDKVDPLEIARLATERAERVAAEMERKMVEYKQVLDDLRQAQKWLQYATALQEDKRAQQLWNLRGVPESWQSYWQLGYCRDFSVPTDAGIWHTDTLTIPVFGKGWEPLNIRHRLIRPFKPNDKYRPDRPGLKAKPFICDPDIGYDCERVLIVEGEIKSMVTYLTLDSQKWQVIGIPGKSNKIAEQLKGADVFICLDPDAQEEAKNLARMTKGRVIDLPDKIDDMIIRKELDQVQLRNIIRAAKRL